MLAVWALAAAMALSSTEWRGISDGLNRRSSWLVRRPRCFIACPGCKSEGNDWAPRPAASSFLSPELLDRVQAGWGRSRAPAGREWRRMHSVVGCAGGAATEMIGRKTARSGKGRKPHQKVNILAVEEDMDEDKNATEAKNMDEEDKMDEEDGKDRLIAELQQERAEALERVRAALDQAGADTDSIFKGVMRPLNQTRGFVVAAQEEPFVIESNPMPEEILMKQRGTQQQPIADDGELNDGDVLNTTVPTEKMRSVQQDFNWYEGMELPDGIELNGTYEFTKEELDALPIPEHDPDWGPDSDAAKRNESVKDFLSMSLGDYINKRIRRGDPDYIFEEPHQYGPKKRRSRVWDRPRAYEYDRNNYNQHYNYRRSRMRHDNYYRGGRPRDDGGYYYNRGRPRIRSQSRDRD